MTAAPVKVKTLAYSEINIESDFDAHEWSCSYLSHQIVRQKCSPAANSVALLGDGVTKQNNGLTIRHVGVHSCSVSDRWM